jgi:hypothetical protein
MLNLFKKNSYWLGIIVSTIAPFVVFVILRFLVDYLSERFTEGFPLIRDHNVILFSIFLNMIIFTPYLHRAPYDKTGRGVMIVTFVMTVIYFIWRFIYLYK